MQNLRDKLLKAGLVTEDQAKKVETSAPSRPAPASQPRREEARGPRRDDHRPRRDEGRGPPPRREGGRPPQGRPPQGRAPAAAAPPVPRLPPMPGSREAQRLESKKQQELARALRELVAGNQVPIDVGASVFYFMTRKGKLRRLELTEAQAKQLEDGTLAVVERPEPAQIEHSLVPAAAAEQMYALSQKSVRFLNRKESPIGFMSDDQVKEQQEAEARGDEPVDEGDDEPTEGEESAAAEAAAEGTPGSEGSTEPTPS